MDKLAEWFQQTDKTFKILKHYTIDYKNKQQRRVFVDRQSKVLFVAHLDTVQTPKYIGKHKKRVYASGLDDRLGCWLAWTLSEELGADLLLTDLEERGATTAQYHDCKQYNWVAEFDRGGADVVTYGLDNDAFKRALKEFFNIGQGIFSDVCWLHSSACCVNVGIGYHRSHSKDSYADTRQMNRQVERFKQFYHKNKDRAFERDYQELIPDFTLDYQIPRSYLDPDDELFDDTLAITYRSCEICGDFGEWVFDHVICRHCFETMLWERAGILRRQQ